MTTNPADATRRIAELERKIAQREQDRESPSDRQARALGRPRPRPADEAPSGATARAAAMLTGQGDA